MINGFSIDPRRSRSTIRLWLFHKDAERQAERLQLDRQCAGDRQEPRQNRHDRLVESGHDVEGMSPWVVGDVDVCCDYTSLTHLEVDGCHPCDGTSATASKLLSFLLTGSSQSPSLRCSNPHPPATHPPGLVRDIHGKDVRTRPEPLHRRAALSWNTPPSRHPPL